MQYDVPTVVTPIYSTQPGVAQAPYAVREPRAHGFGQDPACQCGGSMLSKALWIAGGAAVVYFFRKPIGNFLIGFDPESKLPGKAVRGTKRAVGAAASGTKRVISAARSSAMEIAESAKETE